MALKVGNTEISDLKLGTTDVQKVYKGTNLIWERNATLKLIQFYDNVEIVEAAACAIGSNANGADDYYFDGVGNYPAVGDTIYVLPTASPSNALVGGFVWYLTEDDEIAYKINSDGLVIDSLQCLF